MSDKSGFTLSSPPTPTLTKEGYTLSRCAPVGGGDLTVTVADIESYVATAGIVSPNNAANAGEIVGIYATSASKGRPTLDHVTGVETIATGSTNTYTDELGAPQNVLATENAGKEVCLLDEDCNRIPDATVDDTVEWVIAEGTCMVWSFDIA